MDRVKLPLLPSDAAPITPELPHFVTGELRSLANESAGFQREAQYIYYRAWKASVKRQPELFEKLFATVNWEPGRIYDNYRMAQEFFGEEAAARGTTVHHMLFEFPVEFDEWFDAEDKGGQKDASAEKSLLMKFMLKSADPNILRRLYEFRGRPLELGDVLSYNHFDWAREQHLTIPTPGRNFLRAVCGRVTMLRYADIYLAGGIPPLLLRRLDFDGEELVIEAMLHGAEAVYAASAICAGIQDIELIVNGSKNSLPLEYLGAVGR
jgi:hypothetical protein